MKVLAAYVILFVVLLYGVAIPVVHKLQDAMKQHVVICQSIK